MKTNLLLFLLITGCANTPPVPTFAETAEDFESKKVTYERITVDVEADCEEGECVIAEDTLTKVMQIITRMNDEAEMRVTAYNYSIDSLSHATYAYNMLDRALSQSNKAYDKLEWTNIVKQSLLGLMCIGGLAL
jgi:hypothetical protein